QRLRRREIAALEEDLAELVLARRRLAVLLAVHGLADCERLARQRLGVGPASAIAENPRELDQRDRDVGVDVPQQAPAHGEPFAQQRLRGPDVAELTLEHAERVEALRQADVIGAQRAASDGQRLL